MKSEKGIKIEILSGPERCVEGDKVHIDYLYGYREFKILSRRTETTLIDSTSVKNSFIVLNQVGAKAEIEHAKIIIIPEEMLFVPMFKLLKHATAYIDSICKKGVI